jgi:hypothetical protein
MGEYLTAWSDMLGQWTFRHRFSGLLKWRQFEPEVILLAVGWYLRLMAFLVSPAAKWLTGTSVRMDGGEIKGI